jgi:hypothetical protein
MTRSDPERLWDAIVHMHSRVSGLPGILIICGKSNEVKGHIDFCTRISEAYSQFWMYWSRE